MRERKKRLKNVNFTFYCKASQKMFKCVHKNKISMRKNAKKSYKNKMQK